MPRTQTSTERRQQRQSRETIQRREDSVEQTGRSALNANAARSRHERRRRAVIRREQHILRQHAGMTGIVLMLAVLVLLPFVPFLDFAMASGTTHYIVKTSFPYLDTDALEMRKIGICIGIFLLEVVGGIFLSVRRDEGQLTEVRYWAIGGALLALGMAGMSFVVTGAAPTMQMLTGPESTIPLLTALIALLFHAATIFGGDHIRFAFELALVLLIATALSIAGAIAGATSRRKLTQLERADRLYERSRVEYEQDFGTAIPRPRFAADIEQLLAVIKGRETEQPTPPPPPPPTPSTPATPEPPRPAAAPDEQPSYADLFADDEARRAESEVTA